jgi:tetratricopeptide (TPR) repeat protein
MIRTLFSTLVLVSAATAAFAQTAAPRILVVPFENAGREPRLHWLSEASAVLLADALNARGAGAITRSERLRAFEQLHLPPTASLSRATVIKVGQMVGASEVILGSYSVADERLAVSVHRVRIDVGRLQPDLSERAPLPELFTLFDRIAERLSDDGRALPASSRAALPPLDAFENYIKGLIAESPAAQAAFLETAIAQHRGYDRAQLALWEVRTDQGEYEAALAAARGVSKGSRFERRGRFLGAVSLLHLSRLDEAFDEFKALLADAPAAAPGAAVNPGAALLNNLGVVQIRRGGTPETGLATYYLTQAAKADPGDADVLFNLGYAYVLEKNHQGAIYWVREALRRNPADADAHYVLAAALLGTGATVEAAREKDLARQLAEHFADLEKRAAADKLPVPKGLERVSTELDAPRAISPEQTITNSAQREQRDLATFHLDRGRRLYEREEDREAMNELRRAVYLSPYEAQAHLLIGRIHLRAGRPEEAVDALKISIWSQDTAPAHLALAEAYLKLGNTTAARSELERTLVLDPDSLEARKLLAGIAGKT